MFHIQYDGTVFDHKDHTVLGGDADTILARLSESFADGLDVGAAVRAGVAALAGPDRTLAAAELEVALLARGNGRRCFRRLDDDAVAAAPLDRAPDPGAGAVARQRRRRRP